MVNKTGTDVGVRSEVGILGGPRTAVAYAVTVHFDDAHLAARIRVMDALRTLGLELLEAVH